MAIQVISDPHASRSAGLGAAAGRGLGGMLQGLANMQLQEYAERKQSQKMAAGLSAMGIPDEVSTQIANLPTKLQQMFLTKFFGSEAFGPQQEAGEGEEQQPYGVEQPYDIEQPSMVGQQPQQWPQVSPQEQQLLESMQAPVGQQLGQQGLGDVLSQLSPETQGLLSQAAIPQQEAIPAMPSRMEVPSAEIRRPAPRRDVAPAGASRQGKAAFKLQRKPTAKKTFQELLATPRPTAADRDKAEERLFKREQMTEAKQERINKETKSYHDENMAKYKFARETDRNLGRMKALNDSGKLTPALFASFMKTVKHGFWGVGLDLKGLQSPESQEFEKLSMEFVKHAKAIFGPKMTQKEVEMFMETIPTLTQTPEARNRLMHNMKLSNEAIKIRKNAMEEVIDMNGGERPKNIELIVERKIASKLDALSKSFTKGLVRYRSKKDGPTAESAFWNAISIAKKGATGLLD